MSVNDSAIVRGLGGGNPGQFFVKVAINGLGDVPVGVAFANLFAYKLSV